MGRNISPRIVTDGIVGYWDAANPKSYPGTNTWFSLTSALSVTCNTSFDNGFVQQDNIKINQLSIGQLNSYSTISISVSVKSNSFSKGTLFSVYSNNANKQYANSTVVSLPTATSNTVSSNTVNVGYSYANSTVVSLSMANDNTLSSNTVDVGYSYANSGTISLPNANGNTVTSNTVNIGYSYANSTVVSLPTANGDTAVTSQEIYQDYPEYDISAYFDNDSINTRFKNMDYDLTVNSKYNPSNNDIFTFVFKKSTNDYNVKIYQNNDMLIQNGNVSGLTSFGTNLSFLSRNNLGEATSTPTRFVLIYNRELTDSEIKTISTALRKV